MDEIKNDKSIRIYGVIYKDIMRTKKLTGVSKLIYSYLISFSGGQDKVFPGIELMADELGFSKKTIIKHRKQLEDIGLLTVEKVITKNGHKNIYHLKDIDFRNNKNNNTINHNFNKNNDKDCATNVASELENQLTKEFENWYNLYDKKKDRKAAFTKFKTARKKHSYEEIVKGTKEYLKTITNKQYQKYPKTFLNNESYLDDYSNDIKNNESSYLDKVLNKEDPFDEVL